MEKFYLDEHIRREKSGVCESFEALCARISAALREEWESGRENATEILERQKRAIIGYERELSYFLGKIKLLISEWQAEETEFPVWYESLEKGVFHEIWGMAGMTEWFDESHRDSSSAKIIGENIFFLEEGMMKRKPQKISKERREQLIRALLMLTPEERLDKDFHEVYLLDGTRITIFRNRMVKRDREVIIFRRYVVPSYTFEEQAKRGTIPKEAINFFKAMVAVGYNTAFIGAVRTSKTTFLSTWQSYENESLEGVLVETDPEIPLHVLMPTAPVIQLLADGNRLESITKNLLRSDADYFIMAEARDGVAMDTVIKIASKGTKRMKITFHSRNPDDFPYDAAAEIVKAYGGDIEYNACRVASSFDYIFHFIQLQDKRKKRLKSISEMSCSNGKIKTAPICEYDFETDSWRWYDNLSQEKLDMARIEDKEAYSVMKDEFEKLLKGG